MAPLQITPDPSDEEVAAIAAAVEVLSPPHPVGGVGDPTPRWRWSGRWWSKPIPQRRNRP